MSLKTPAKAMPTLPTRGSTPKLRSFEGAVHYTLPCCPVKLWIGVWRIWGWAPQRISQDLPEVFGREDVGFGLTFHFILLFCLVSRRLLFQHIHWKFRVQHIQHIQHISCEPHRDVSRLGQMDVFTHITLRMWALHPNPVIRHHVPGLSHWDWAGTVPMVAADVWG